MHSGDMWSYITDNLSTGNFENNGDEFGMTCPGCGDESHFSVSTSGFYNCYKCSVGGSIAREISKNWQTWKRYSSKTQNQPTRFGPLSSTKLQLSSLTHVLRLVGGVSKNDRSWRSEGSAMTRAKVYCSGRGISFPQMDLYRVFIKPMDPRVYFPIWDENGDFTFTMGRGLFDSIEPKTLEWYRDTDKKPLFGRHVRPVQSDVFLVEGVFDHLVTPMSYAVLGSSVVESQIRQLVEDGIKRVFIIFDPEAGEATEQARLRLVRRRFDVFPVVLNTTSDPSKLGVEIMRRVVRTLIAHSPSRPQTITLDV
ncbi:hypothetical protein KAR91_32515 [Candidatus Pacearchaeota archaeon]|nr:hypothetical protein [Candidatus Pacearchaeota archaeon]